MSNVAGIGLLVALLLLRKSEIECAGAVWFGGNSAPLAETEELMQLWVRESRGESSGHCGVVP